MNGWMNQLEQKTFSYKNHKLNGDGTERKNNYDQMNGWIQTKSDKREAKRTKMHNERQ